MQRPALTGPIRRARPIARRQVSSLNICAKLVTVQNGRKHIIVVGLNKPAIIGRDPNRCTYVVEDLQVSGLHCEISAVKSPNGGVLVSCEDFSKNGIILNEQRIRNGRVILMDGDSLRLPDSITFTVIHLWKEPREKVTAFEPTPPQRATHKQIGRYLVVTSHCLGSGTFATVHLALDTENRRQIACKTIRTKENKNVEKEVQILKKLSHPNINRIYGSEVDDNFIYIFLQLCAGGDLFTYITSRPELELRLCEAEAKYIMFQLLKALKYLHDKSISHRDLKPENILLYGPGPYPRILLADFGLARLQSYQATFNVCGTVPYLPPEGIIALHSRHKGYVGVPADCWSAGVTLYVMLSGSHPFDYGGTTTGSSHNWKIRIQDSHKIASQLQASQDLAHLEGSQDGEYLCQECRGLASRIQDSQDPASPIRDSHGLASHIQDSHDLASRIQDSDDFASPSRDSQDSPLPSSSRCSRCYCKAEKRAKNRIINGVINFERSPWDRLPKAKVLIRRLLEEDPRHRATVYSALKSEWIISDLEKLKAAYQERIIALLPPAERPTKRPV